ncbi:MAG: hypothetical protein IKX14_06600 [Neisseriaceae bacterium]|nr:hypothetical protein [Neisseriaceae bacterium]
MWCETRFRSKFKGCFVFFRLPERVLSVLVGKNAHPTITPLAWRWAESPPYNSSFGGLKTHPTI